MDVTFRWDGRAYKVTRWELASMLFSGEQINVMADGGPIGYGKRSLLRSIERQDGSGRSFNVTLTVYNPGRYETPAVETVYVRTID